MAGTIGTTLYNRNEVQKSIKGMDGQTYWIPPKKHTTVPTAVDTAKLPKGVKLGVANLVKQAKNK
jgi:hypothetical protein